jgi:1-acyl-sn-glycerol-3-phosphate acyltransferase
MSVRARHAEVWPPLYRVGRALVVGWAKALNGYEVAGRRTITPGRGCLVVCSHLADIDGMFVGAALPPSRMVIHLVTARHHEGSPLARELLLRLGLEPVRTDGTEMAALRHCRRVLAAGGIVVIYPEGVPGYSARVQPFAEGVGWLALTPGIDVVPAAIWGSHRVMRRGLPIGRGPVRVAFGAPIDLAHLTGRRPERVEQATAIARTCVQQLVTSLAVNPRVPGT